jgi:hypothetical protein
MDAGKPKNQALAIAYNVKRRAKKAIGGLIEDQHGPNPDNGDTDLTASAESPFQEASEMPDEAIDNSFGDKQQRLGKIMQRLRMKHIGK